MEQLSYRIPNIITRIKNTTTLFSQNKASNTAPRVVRTNSSMEMDAPREPKLPGVGAGAPSLTPTVVGAPATELGETANGDSAAAE